MNNPTILREVENASTAYNRNKLLSSEENVHKMKTKVLGEVKNTLHSRSGNFVTPNWPSSAKAKSKSSVLPRVTSDENLMSKRNTALGKQYLTPLKVAEESLLTSTNIDADMLEIHNHVLCEQAEESHQNDCFTEYKFSEKQIENLVQSVKISAASVSTNACEPCEDIVIPDDKPEEKSFSFEDILSNLIVPQVPSLIMVLCNAF